MTISDLTTERVIELIEAYGAEPGAWPEIERDAALAIIAEDAATFEPLLAEARMIDESLSKERVPEPAADLAARILAQAPQPRRLSWPSILDIKGLLPTGIRWPAGAALASLVVGIVGGYSYASTDVLTYDEANEIYYSAFGYDADAVWLTEESAE